MKWIAGIIALIGLMAGFVFWKAAPMTVAGSSFTAKTICSGVFVSGLPADRVWTEEVLPTSEAFEMIGYNIDHEAGEVRASAKGIGERRAIYREGLGCTLAIDGAPEHVDAATPSGQFAPLSRRVLAPAQVKVLSDALEAAFTQPINDGPPQTRAIVVVHGGEVIAERYGEGITAATPLKGWSMNKTLTGLVIGMLGDRGWLDLDAGAPVPEWTDEHDPRRMITVRQLTTMSSGLDFLEDYSDLGSDVVKMLFDARSAATRAAVSPLGHDAGTHWYYSSGTTNILARLAGDVLETRGQTLPAFMQTQLFEPLDVKTAVMEVDAGGDFVGSSFGYMGAHDWGRMGRLFLDEGRAPDGEAVVPADWIRFMTTRNGLSDGQYGAQIWLNRVPPGHESYMKGVPEDAAMFLGHDGQFVAVIPSLDLVVVRLGETPTWSLKEGAGEILRAAVLTAEALEAPDVAAQ